MKCLILLNKMQFFVHDGKGLLGSEKNEENTEIKSIIPKINDPCDINFILVILINDKKGELKWQ